MSAGGILVKRRVVCGCLMHTLEMHQKCNQWNFQQTHDIFIKISVVIRLSAQIAESIESRWWSIDMVCDSCGVMLQSIGARNNQ